MSKVPRYIKLNTCVEYCTKDQRTAMSKVSKIHCMDLNALNAMYVGDVGDNTTGDNRLHCIALSLFYFMSKTSEMCTMTTNYNVNSNSKYTN